MDKEQVLKLAKLARIELSDTEALNLSHEFEAILKYVSEVKNVRGEAEGKEPQPEDFPIRNVMREDGEGHESGIHTKELVEAAPSNTGEYIKVKKIL